MEELPRRLLQLAVLGVFGVVDFFLFRLNQRDADNSNREKQRYSPSPSSHEKKTTRENSS